jgi:hypothetical protein
MKQEAAELRQFPQQSCPLPCLFFPLLNVAALAEDLIINFLSESVWGRFSRQAGDSTGSNKSVCLQNHLPMALKLGAELLDPTGQERNTVAYAVNWTGWRV